MFIRYYIELSLPVAKVEQELVGSPAGWLSAVAGEAQARGDGLLGGDRTQLAISARYHPALGALGRAVDLVLLHRVAEATMKDFLDRVGAVIREQAMTNADIQVVGHEGGVEAHAP
jgi:hypothetical protein